MTFKNQIFVCETVAIYHIIVIREVTPLTGVTKLWNISIGKLLDCPTLSVRPFTNGCQFIISGSTKNSDLTIPVGLFKKRLKIY